MHKLISSAALVVAGLLSTAAQAQTAPPNGWNAHIAGCFASDPTFADPSRGFERLPTPADAQRTTVTFTTAGGGRVMRMAVWRQDCANNPAFPILMVRFEQIRDAQFQNVSVSAIVQNRDVELIQGGVATHAEVLGTCAASACLGSAQTFVDENTLSFNATMIVAQARDPNVLLRNGFQFRLRGTAEVVTVGGTTGGGGDLPLAGRLNGTYFDPARSGEGILVDFFDAGANKGVFVSWYTFDDAGNALWLVGNATLAPNGTQVDVPLIVTTGGRFGPLFNPANISRTGWGTINLRFPNCSSAVMRYTRLSDGQTGQYTMSRLGPASGVSC
jgi:hypothetical protein